VEEKKKLNIFSSIEYHLPATTASLASRVGVEPLQELLASCQNTRSEVWKLLEKHIKKAIRERTESTASDPDF
jgi:hypothetical protein